MTCIVCEGHTLGTDLRGGDSDDLDQMCKLTAGIRMNNRVRCASEFCEHIIICFLADTQRGFQTVLVPAVLLKLSQTFLVVIRRITVRHQEDDRRKGQGRRIQEAVARHTNRKLLECRTHTRNTVCTKSRPLEILNGNRLRVHPHNAVREGQNRDLNVCVCFTDAADLRDQLLHDGIQLTHLGALHTARGVDQEEDDQTLTRYARRVQRVVIVEVHEIRIGILVNTVIVIRRSVVVIGLLIFIVIIKA